MKEINFEEAIKRLNEITDKLQNNECSLDESLVLFEEGVKLAKECSNRLDYYQEKIKEISDKMEKENA